MDRYLAMHCFCRVVETGSFAAASRDLDCSRSVVTKYIQFLEDWSGTRLLARTTRTMQLTDAGTRFYAYCRRVMDDTDATLGELRLRSAPLLAGSRDAFITDLDTRSAWGSVLQLGVELPIDPTWSVSLDALKIFLKT